MYIFTKWNPINTDKYPYKLKWLSNFNFIKEIKKYDGIIIGGDFNIIPNSNDVGILRIGKMTLFINWKLEKNLENIKSGF